MREHFADVVRPLARIKLVADGERVLVGTADRKHVIDATAEGQVVISFAVAPFAREVEAKVAELGAPRDLEVRVRGRTYRAVLTPDLAAGGYTVQVPECPGVVTEADGVAEARRMAADAIRLWLDAGANRVSTRMAR